MALKIVKSDEPIKVEQIITVIYGSPGIGKSTLGFSAESPLLLDFDKGAHRAANRKDIVSVDSWPEVADISSDDLKNYKPVVVDTAGRALDLLTVDIIRRNKKLGYGGALTLQGYGQLKSEFTAWLKQLKSFGLDVVLISHSSEDKKGDDLIERLDIQGGSKGEIYKSADAMGRLYIENGKRILNFSPTDVAFGKNPGGFEPLPVSSIYDEPDFLGDVVSLIKDKLNQLSEEQKKRMEEIDKWSVKFSEATKAEDFTRLVSEIKEASPTTLQVLKSLLHNAATKAGMIYEKGKGYVNPSN
jgi:hypothetical protein